jgi:hypothetical protein
VRLLNGLVFAVVLGTFGLLSMALMDWIAGNWHIVFPAVR